MGAKRPDQLVFLPSDSTDPEPLTAAQRVPGLLYVPEFITPADECELLAHLDGEPWLSDLKRRVQHYGFKYAYRARAIDSSMSLGPMPAWLLPVRRRLVERGIFFRVA